MSDLPTRWVTLTQAATITGRHRRTLDRWITEGRLTAHTLGGARWVRELDALTVERDTRQAAHAGRPGRQGPRKPTGHWPLTTGCAILHHDGPPPTPP